MDPVGKLIKVLLALALSGLVLYFFGVGRGSQGPQPRPAASAPAR